MNLYQNKYRIPSARLPNWDYRNAGAYFITICTQNREHFFGEINDGKMNYSALGGIADVLWYDLKNRFPYVELGEFVVMPNHIHGILILNNDNPLHDITDNQQKLSIHDSLYNSVDSVETLHATSLQPQQPQQSPIDNKNEQMANISPKSGSVSTIIRSYKSAVTFHVRRLGWEFAWQTRFYDHIIRNDDDFIKITEYIINNPKKWKEDKFYD